MPNLTRRELYALIWSEPASSLAKRYGLSDRGLGKLCARHDIPVPPRGWWAKKAAGHRVRPELLPPLRSGQSEMITIRHQQPKPEAVVPQESHVPEIAFEQRLENHIVVPSRLGRPHPFIRRTSEALRESKVHERGLLLPKGPALNIRVSRQQIPRALRLMDALIKSFEVRGYHPELPEKGIGLSVNVLGERFNVSLMEVTTKKERPPTEWEKRLIAENPKRAKPYDLVPCGDLALTISDAHYDCYQMRDATKKRLEDGLNRFVIRLIEEALQDKYLRAERERRRIEQQERDRIHAEEEHLRQEEEDKVKQWNGWMSDWKRAKEVREFAAALREARQPIEAESSLFAWLKWADEYAEGVDPLT
jgi:hypothetical protein